MTTRTRSSRKRPAMPAIKRSRKVRIKPGTCFACGCTDEFGCDRGCSWVDGDHTMCSECHRVATAWLAWFRGMHPPSALVTLAREIVAT